MNLLKVVTILVLLVIGTLLFLLWSTISAPKYLTNTSELYSLFTPYMKDTVDYRLRLIDCEPKKYYYNDSVVCFICDVGDACFGYGWTHRNGGEKMNLVETPYLKNVNEISVKVADFYKDGLASEFNCKKKNQTTLECNGIAFLLNGLKVNMILSDLSDFENVSKKICMFFGETITKCENLICECGKWTVGSSEEKEIGYSRYFFGWEELV